MLDGKLEHIVLVHYREVKEGYKSSISHFVADRGLQDGGCEITPTCFPLEKSSLSTIQTPFATGTRNERIGQAISSELHDAGSLVSLNLSTPVTEVYRLSQNASHISSEKAEIPAASTNQSLPWFAEGNDNINTGPILAEIHSTNADRAPVQEFNVDRKLYAGQPGIADFHTHKQTHAALEADGKASAIASRNRIFDDPEIQRELAASHEVALENGPFQKCSPIMGYSVAPVKCKSNSARVNSNEELGNLRKLESFGRWMDNGVGQDCDDSLMASVSGNYWSTHNTETDGKEVSSPSFHTHLDTDSLPPSLSQEQLFSISDFSPDWAYSGIETKVLIVGTFLRSKDLSTKTKWGCMFGEIEVPAEILTNSSIRCIAPPHPPGRFPFYVTCSNRLACSEVREFEYREMPPISTNIDPYEEICLQIHLAKLLYLNAEDQTFRCLYEKCNECEKRICMYPMKAVGEGDNDLELSKLEHIYPRDAAFQCLFRNRLGQWLVSDIHEGAKGLNILDEEGQGVIHLTAALGYGWAMGPIIAAGVTPNFRDSHGRTGLHWASYFGREETVIALVQFGTDPSLVDDPTMSFPAGRTAADLASSRGHKGIAGYLAEVDLTSSLSKLNVGDDSIDNVNFASKSVNDIASEIFSPSATHDEILSLRGTLAAVRKSAHAAALIQAAFHARSFHQRQSTKGSDSVVSEISTDLVALGFLHKLEKVGHFEDYLHSAAIKIQQKYRRWKGRKEFLKIRNRIVKVQALVRGHQVRKQYKKVVWSVSIVEKAILRWRRKRVGLRAFRVVKTEDASQIETENTDEYDYLRISRKQKFDGVERALARVKSMVRDPRARDQYMRMISKFDNCKMP
ncbi:hypothetical protein SAY86_024691 [Trapa natans]|uniref:CG-1 domain-containing protein n=1 Tax=Trapa natans TaxID=22666 RepID=A0AAN7MQC1_TRANT|nr:hypothetical protein SAY86_024691 [Trapa natans]